MASNGTAQGTFNVALMTSGGLAPCLSSSVAHLIAHWKEAKDTGKISGLNIRCYRDGYKGMLIGDSFVVDDDVFANVDALHDLGGSPIGNSRVKVSSNYSVILVTPRRILRWARTQRSALLDLVTPHVTPS